MIPRDSVFDKLSRWAFPLCLLCGNLLVALGTELAHDEAYYWLFSKHLAWGYFDHPPMAAWLIALTAWIPGELGVRLGFVLGIQGTGWLLSRLVPQTRRWFVWFALCCFPLLSFSGVFAIPDGPLVFMSAVWLWALHRSLKQDNFLNAALMGVATALMLYSKYHGVLFIAATLLAIPRLLLRPTFWFSAVVGLLAFLPHVHWQWAHDFATFRYHFFDRPKVDVGWQQPLEYVLLQVILPGVFIAPFVWWKFFQRKADGEFERALKFMAVFVPAFFFFSTFSKKVEGNWTVAAGLPLLLYVARGDWTFTRLQKILAGFSVALVLAAKLILVLPPNWHGIDRAQEFHGWKAWSQHVRAVAGDCHLATNRYQFASKLSFYLQEEIPALNVGTRLNQFEFWDWQNQWAQGPVCWVTERNIFLKRPVPTPDGKNLGVVIGVPLSDILMHKDRSL